MADITKKQVDEVLASLKGIFGEDSEQTELGEIFIRALAVDDDKFAIIAPGILQSYQQALNNPNDRLAVVAQVNAYNLKAEDIIDNFISLSKEVDEMGISAQKRDFIKQILASLIQAINETKGISKRMVPVAIELCNEDAKVPQYAHISDSGADVYALEDITVKPGETVLVPTGFKVALPPGYELQVRPKSGRALKTKLRVANTPGTIDQGYRDEVKVIIENVEAPIQDITVDDEGRVTSILYGKDFTIGKGEKFAQLVLCEVPKAVFYRVENIMEVDEENRGGGFGSSGLK